MPCSTTSGTSDPPSLRLGDLILLSAKQKASAVPKYKISRLNHFDLVAYGLPSRCLRLTHFVTSIGSKLAPECSEHCFPGGTFTPTIKRLVAHLFGLLTTYHIPRSGLTSSVSALTLEVAAIFKSLLLSCLDGSTSKILSQISKTPP